MPHAEKNTQDRGLAVDNFDAYEGGNPVGQYSKNIDKASAGNISLVSLRYTTDPTNEPHIVLGYVQTQLLLAEAKVKGWLNTSDAETNYENAVKASFKFYNRYAANYSSYVDDQAVEHYLEGDLVKFSASDSKVNKIQKS